MSGLPILYNDLVLQEDLPRIPRNLQARIRKAIESRLGIAPDRYGRRLSRSLLGLWRIRVGDYRVIYEIEAGRVRVWMIAHRKEAYQAISRRLGTES